MCPGNVAGGVQETAAVARSFLQAHEAWLEEELGPLALRPSSADENVHMNLEQTLSQLDGRSVGTALLGE